MKGKRLRISKTFWMGVLAIAGGVVEYLYGLPPGVAAGTIAVGIINIIIRFYTNQPISKI